MMALRKSQSLYFYHFNETLMKTKVLLFSLAVSLLFASCAHHICPTYQNSALKYHHHQAHHPHQPPH